MRDLKSFVELKQMVRLKATHCHYCNVAREDFHETQKQVDNLRSGRPYILSPHRGTIDHKIAKCKGGVDSSDNMVVSCYSCNHEKADLYSYEEYKTAKAMSPEEFSEYHSKKLLLSREKYMVTDKDIEEIKEIHQKQITDEKAKKLSLKALEILFICSVLKIDIKKIIKELDDEYEHILKSIKKKRFVKYYNSQESF